MLSQIKFILNYKQFIRGLFVIFRCNGCHFSSRKMKFLINTILFSFDSSFFSLFVVIVPPRTNCDMGLLEEF